MCKHSPFSHRRIGLAVSGGADSTALVVLMADLRSELNFDAFVLHVDHALRNDSADDAEFVRQLAAQYAMPFFSTRLNVVLRRRESIELAAGGELLAFFDRMTLELHLDAIATGHHADDVAETFILRLARGAGPEGLAGLKRISHVNHITFIRPLLDIRDYELRRFLAERHIPWREDSTNTDTSIPRNHVRHVVIPWLREHLDPRITEHLCKSAAILRGDLQNPSGFPQNPSGFPPNPSGFPPNPPADKFKLSIAPCIGFSRSPQAIRILPAVCELSRAALAGRTLRLRPWCAGDRIAPTGMHGRSRKLQDVFVTAKTPPALRSVIPILTDAATGEVLWLPGYRVAESVAVESPHAPSWRFTLESDTP